MPSSANHPQTLFILNFHGLGKPADNLTPGELHCWLETSFFTDILEAVRGRDDVRLTFDDGNASDHAIALPLLKARNMKAKFFVLAHRLDQPGYLSQGQVRELCAEGMQIGNHGMRHRKWAGLSAGELEEELIVARENLREVSQQPVAEAACPFGSYGRHVLRKLRQAGYERVYTSDGGPTASSAWLQPRNTIVRSFDTVKIASLTREIPAGPKRLWRQCKLWLKRWR
jgi:peptidoglycan/xylan/chitin deacetylase (PgdA/CDA1 family)